VLRPHLVLRLYRRRGRLCRLAVRSRDPQLPGQRRIAMTRQPRRRPLRVFLNYRREDASGHAGRLYDLLVARYGAERVFMDIDAIPLGSEFGQAISRAVASCDVLIALMGRGWLQAADSDGHRRLDDPDDFVRREIESALAHGVVVVPTTVQGAELPRAEELPPALAPLTQRQGFELSDKGWQDDVKRLIRRLEAVVAQEQPDRAADHPAPSRRSRPTGRILAAAVLGSLALIAAFATVLLRGGGDGGDNSPPGESAGGGQQPSGLSQAGGTVTLGSDLRTSPTGDHWYCTGSGAESPACSFVVTRFPEIDRLVKAPFAGVVTRWQVQGAGGPIRLIVARGEIRPGGRSSLARVQGSTEQLVRSTRRQTFRTRLPIRKGDAVGLQLSVGAYGNAPYAAGTWLEIWIPPLGPERERALDSGSRDYEMLYNAVIERDRDGDGFGDVTQDNCPKDPDKQEGC
jgi:TIR domain